MAAAAASSVTRRLARADGGAVGATRIAPPAPRGVVTQTVATSVLLEGPRPEIETLLVTDGPEPADAGSRVGTAVAVRIDPPAPQGAATPTAEIAAGELVTAREVTLETRTVEAAVAEDAEAGSDPARRTEYFAAVS